MENVEQCVSNDDRRPNLNDERSNEGEKELIDAPQFRLFMTNILSSNSKHFSGYIC